MSVEETNNVDPCNSENSDWRGCMNAEKKQRLNDDLKQDVDDATTNVHSSFHRKHWESRPRLTFHKPNKSHNFKPYKGRNTNNGNNYAHAGNVIRHANRFGVVLKCIATDRYLMVRQLSNGFIGAPKGSRETYKLEHDVEVNEDDFVCARRELLEECGLYVELEDLRKAIKLTATPDEKYGLRMYTFYLLGCETELECKVDTKEIESYCWMTLDQIKATRKASFTHRMTQSLTHLQSHNLHIVVPKPIDDLTPDFVSSILSPKVLSSDKFTTLSEESTAKNEDVQDKTNNVNNENF
jgi:ADP-ribose pyrophosphatase YjhB (NUDIX family)